MRTLLGTIENDPTTTYPASTVAAGILVLLTETTTSAVLKSLAPVGATAVTIADVPPGTYSAVFGLADSEDVFISGPTPAEPATITVVDVPQTIVIATPTKLTLTVAP